MVLLCVAGHDLAQFWRLKAEDGLEELLVAAGMRPVE